MTTRPQPDPRRTTTTTVPGAPGNAVRPRPVVVSRVSPPDPDRGTRHFLGLSWPLWLLLGLSVAFLFSSHFYVTRVEQRLDAAFRPSPTLTTLPQPAPVRIGDLRLSWQPVEGAETYRLHVETVTGAIVVDGLLVPECDWMPPLDALPGFPAGEYRWRVDALDSSGETLCRSQSESFRIL